VDNSSGRLVGTVAIDAVSMRIVDWKRKRMHPQITQITQIEIKSFRANLRNLCNLRIDQIYLTLNATTAIPPGATRTFNVL